MPASRLLILFVLLVSLPAAGQEIPFWAAKRWLNQLAASRPDSNRVNNLLNLAEYYQLKPGSDKTDIDSAFLLVDQASQLSHRIGYQKGMEQAVFLQCRINVELNREDSLSRIFPTLSDVNKTRVLLEEGVHYIFVDPTYWKERIDQLCRLTQRISRTNHDPRIKYLRYELLGLHYVRMGMMEKGKWFARQSIRYLDSNGYPDEAWQFCYRLLLLPNSYPAAAFSEFYYLRPAQSALHAGDYFKAYKEYIKWIEMAAWRREYKTAIHYGLEAYKLVPKIPDTDRVNLTNRLAKLYYNHGDIYNTLYYSHALLAEVEKQPEAHEDDYRIYQTLAEINFQAGMMEESLDFCEKGLLNIEQFSKKRREPDYGYDVRYFQPVLMRLKASILCNTGHGRQALEFIQACGRESISTFPFAQMILLMSKAECYSALKEYDLAESTFLEGLAGAKKNNLPDYIGIYLPIAKFYTERGAFKKARPFLNALLSSRNEAATDFKMMETHFMLYRADSAAGHFMTALSHLRQYKELNDSIFTLARNGQLEALQVQYALEAKDRDIKMREQRIAFLQKEQGFQKNQLQAAHSIRNIVLAGILLVILLLIVVYKQYRLKQRSNKLLAQQQEIVQDKNRLLESAISEKDALLTEKEDLLTEKDDLLVEKDWLVKEVHHRVKNNLQIIVSLLNIAGRYIDNDEATRCIKESKDRMYAMSLIHQKLYKSEGTEFVDMNDYIRDLVSYLDSNYNAGRRMHFRTNVDSVRLDMALAVPIGLILNEAITNTIKHAFPGTNTGSIRVTMRQEPGSLLRLAVSDDGIGLSPDWKENKKRSMGMHLMKALAGQIHGAFNLVSEHGVSITVEFPAENSKIPATYSNN